MTKIIIWSAMAVVLGALAGCDGSDLAQAEASVRAQLRDPSSAEFSDETVYPAAKDHGIIVCGKVNAKNGFGGMTGARRFIAGGQTIIEDGSSSIATEVFDGVWEKSCRG